MKTICLAVLLLVSRIAAASPVDAASILPPLQPWNGASRALVAPESDPWVTPAEKNHFLTTPDYDETVAWLKKLERSTKNIRIVSIGKSSEGRDVWMVIASSHGFTPEALKNSGLPTVLVQAGIHSGEIDGKDAGMMLLRDITVRGTKKALIDSANFLFVPILNVDGHEMHTSFSRPNQRGPENGGWRKNAANLNLNRDYTKLETPEIAGIVQTINRWNPDLYVDVHVTDGADYQYDVTYGWNRTTAMSASQSAWLGDVFTPAVNGALRAAGHIPGPLVYAQTNDVRDGILDWPTSPRFSHGYGDAHHLASILVENHSLKPYEQRVLGTYVFLENALRIVGSEAASLQKAAREDRDRRPADLPLAWEQGDSSRNWPTIEFLGIESRTALSPVSGALRYEYTGKPLTMRVPVIGGKEVARATRPKAYWVPAAWPEVIARLTQHGIVMERTAKPVTVDVSMYRLAEPKFETSSFEGHVLVTAKTAAIEKRRETYAPGSVRISTDQPLGELAMLLLEPASTDSFLQWGFFNTIFERTEYIESYAIEPMAAQMLAGDPQLKAEFEKRLATDEAFRVNADERLRWFYSRTPYYDDRWLLYPVGREE